jgi:hypothetical protein
MAFLHRPLALRDISSSVIVASGPTLVLARFPIVRICAFPIEVFSYGNVRFKYGLYLTCKTKNINKISRAKAAWNEGAVDGTNMVNINAIFRSICINLQKYKFGLKSSYNLP